MAAKGSNRDVPMTFVFVFGSHETVPGARSVRANKRPLAFGVGGASGEPGPTDEVQRLTRARSTMMSA